jgi:hypothetical protein
MVVDEEVARLTSDRGFGLVHRQKSLKNVDEPSDAIFKRSNPDTGRSLMMDGASMKVGIFRLC